MTWMSRSRGLAAVVVLLALAAALSLALGWSGGAAGRAEAAATEYEISPETRAALAEARPGDRINVVIQNRVAGATVALVDQVFMCPAPFTGVADATVCEVQRWAPSRALADPDGLIEFTATIPPEGENLFPAVPPGRPNAISCAPGDQCAIAFTFAYRPPGGALTRVPDVTSLAFTVKPPLTVEGCGAPRPDQLVDASGPHRLASSEIAWAQRRCEGGRAQDLEFSAIDEVSARDQFRDGLGDVFFGAGGVTAGEDAAAAGKRTSVPVPVGLNAQVLAVHGLFPAQSLTPGLNRATPLTDVKLTADQIADLLIEPGHAFVTAASGVDAGSFADQVLAANSQLAAIDEPTRLTLTTAAYSTHEVGHWIISRYLARNAASTWKYPDTPAYQNRGRSIGPLLDMRPLVPTENVNQVLVADRIGLGKALEGGQFDQECATATSNPVNPACVNLVLTDLATANELRLPVVRVETAPGRFVAPTPESMAAAVDDMTELPDGSLVPDLDENDPEAYPFTFVEYANAAAEMGDACKAQAVRDVLGFLADREGGQRLLAKGLVPLPASLSDRAAQAVQKVGPRTGCGAGSGGAGDGGGSGVDDLVGAALPADASGGAVGTTSAGAAGDHPTRPVTNAGRQQALNAAAGASIPLFAGMAALVLLVPLTALALTQALTSGTAFGAAGRRLPPRLAQALTAARAPLRRAAGKLIRR